MKAFRSFGHIAAVLLLAVASPAHAADDTIDRIKSSGEMRACFADDNPWAFKDPASGKWQGFVPEMAAAFAESMEVKLVEVDANWSALIQSLESNKCDLIAAPLFATVKRGEVVIFSDPYAYEYTTVYVPSDSPIKTYEELNEEGKVIAVRAGTVHPDNAAKYFPKAKTKTYLADSSLAVVTDVAAKRVDGWLDSYISTGRFLATNPQYPVRAIGDKPLEPVQVVWALKPGDYRFQQLTNTFIFTYKSAGKAATSWEKWFGTKYEAP